VPSINPNEIMPPKPAGDKNKALHGIVVGGNIIKGLVVNRGMAGHLAHLGTGFFVPPRFSFTRVNPAFAHP